jgi:hypothetical protein
MLNDSYAVSADVTILIRSHNIYVRTVKMAKCGLKLPSKELYGVKKIQLIKGCNYVQLMLVIESHNGRPKRLGKDKLLLQSCKKVSQLLAGC